MFPLNLQLTPTHTHNIAAIINGCLWDVYLIQLAHVTIKQELILNSLINKDY